MLGLSGTDVPLTPAVPDSTLIVDNADETVPHERRELFGEELSEGIGRLDTK